MKPVWEHAVPARRAFTARFGQCRSACIASPREGRRQHRLPQCLRTLEVRIDLGLDFADDGQAAFDFGDDPMLMIEGWNRQRIVLINPPSDSVVSALESNRAAERALPVTLSPSGTYGLYRPADSPDSEKPLPTARPGA
jgi:hypothetical protein